MLVSNNPSPSCYTTIEHCCDSTAKVISSCGSSVVTCATKVADCIKGCFECLYGMTCVITWPCRQFVACFICAATGELECMVPVPGQGDTWCCPMI